MKDFPPPPPRVLTSPVDHAFAHETPLTLQFFPLPCNGPKLLHLVLCLSN